MIVVISLLTYQLRIGEIWNGVQGEDDDEASDRQRSDGRDHGCRIGRQDPAVTDSQNMVGQDN